MTSERKNHYEELIDKMMIEDVSGIDNEIRETLESLPTDKKRLAILSILDKDRGLFVKIKNMINSNDLTKVEYIKELVKMLREYVKVGDVEVKKHGEVMTDLSLVELMLDQLPNEVWSNPHLKWLDPCSGVGTFSAVIVDRLMDGLSVVIPNEEDRYKHIMETMLYVGELQPKNMFLYLVAFDPHDNIDLNIYTGSYLDSGFDEHKSDVWGVDKFNVVVMNPPYQWKRENEKKSHSLWNKFVLKILNNDLVEDGYLSAIHPSGWRNVEGKFKDVQFALREREIQYLNMNTFKQGFDTFGVKTDYDFYCVKNVFGTDIKTKIIDIDNETSRVKLSDKKFIPNCKLNEVYSLVAKEGEETVEVLHSYSAYETRKEYMSKEQTDEFKYPCVYTVKKDNSLTFKYSLLKDKGHFGIPKVIWGNGATGVFTDKNGVYGLTQFAYGIIDEPENLEYIKKALQNPYFIKYIMAFRDSFGDTYKRKIIATFRKDFWKEFINY
ncbi:MAG: Eco57I restriction-modification methylase domain-containing protein [archaeon]